jgi:hypothetical protein
LHDVQVYSRPQVNRASSVCPFWNDDAAAACGRAGLNGLFEITGLRKASRIRAAMIQSLAGCGWYAQAEMEVSGTVEPAAAISFTNVRRSIGWCAIAGPRIKSAVICLYFLIILWDIATGSNESSGMRVRRLGGGLRSIL